MNVCVQLCNFFGKDFNKTNLSYVLITDNSPELRELLGEECENSDIKDWFSQTLTHIAAQYCTVDVLALLLDHGASVNRYMSDTHRHYSKPFLNICSFAKLLSRV